MISAFLLLLNHRQWSFNQALILIGIAIAGFLAEVIGVNTGWLFGDYSYGKTLGPKMFGVPYLIGINWLILIYISGNLVEQLEFKWPVKAAIGAVLLVFLDLFIEPVAIYFDYWKWEGNQVPWSNYLCWFIISYLFLSLFLKTGFKSYNPVSGVIYIIQFLMFVVLAARI